MHFKLTPVSTFIPIDICFPQQCTQFTFTRSQINWEWVIHSKKTINNHPHLQSKHNFVFLTKFSEHSCYPRNKSPGNGEIGRKEDAQCQILNFKLQHVSSSSTTCWTRQTYNDKTQHIIKICLQINRGTISKQFSSPIDRLFRFLDLLAKLYYFYCRSPRIICLSWVSVRKQ